MVDVRDTYVRIADELREQITSGRIPVGQTLPAYSELSRTYETSRPTAQRAVGVLRDEGLVVTKSGRNRGSIVISDQPSSEEPWVRVLRELEARIDEMAAELTRLQKMVNSGSRDAAPTRRTRERRE